MKIIISLIIPLLISLNIYAGDITIVSPVNNFSYPGFSVTFSWNSVPSVNAYRLKIATDAGFTNIIKDTVMNGTTAQVNLNRNLTGVYWKVTSANTSFFVQSDVYSLSFITPAQDPNLLMW